MKLRIEINMDNAAFGEDAYECGTEAARILRKLADKLEGPGSGDITLYDSNGNPVGTARVTEE